VSRPRSRGGSSDRWSRLHGVMNVEDVRDKSVLVAGLGSGGSTVALELAKAGVGRFTLIDPDAIEESNLIRHECDDRYLGRNKAVAVADLIRRRHPGAEITTLHEDLFGLGPQLERHVAAADLVAVCTDSEPPKHLLNRLCTASRVAAVYAGVYERGTGGEVIRCSGGSGDACYACITSALKEEVPTPPIEELDYGLVQENGTMRGAPGLGIDVRLVALVHAKVCLSTLLKGDDIAGNVVLFGTAAVEGLFPRPFASAVLRIAPQQDCLICEPIRRGLPFDIDATTGV
jgi:molybdopterin/thiamine biosynthesis adenylyltransferase